MVAQNIFFYGLAAVIVYSGFRVVTTNNVVHAALHLVAVLASVAAQYVILAAEFVAATQVLVYIGAIAVLILFAIMITQSKSGPVRLVFQRQWWVGLVAAAVIVVLLVTSILLGIPGKPSAVATISISVGLPLRRSCAVEEYCVGIASAMP